MNTSKEGIFFVDTVGGIFKGKRYVSSIVIKANKSNWEVILKSGDMIVFNASDKGSGELTQSWSPSEKQPFTNVAADTLTDIDNIIIYTKRLSDGIA